MAISKTSAKSESWTVRVPNDLAIAVREKFPAEAGVTEIVIKSLRAYLGINDSDFNSVYGSVLQSDLQEIKSRLDTLEKELSDMKSSVGAAPMNNARPVTISSAADKGNDSEWTNTEVIASRLEILVGIIVEPKSISGAFSKRGKDIGDGVVEIVMKDRNKKIRATVQRRDTTGKEKEYKLVV